MDDICWIYSRHPKPEADVLKDARTAMIALITVLDPAWNIRPSSSWFVMLVGWRGNSLMSPLIIPVKRESPLSFKHEKRPLFNSVESRSSVLQREVKFLIL